MTSIRVPDTISKLNPDDTYAVVEGTDVGGFTDLKTEVNTNTSKIEKAVDAVNALDKTGKTLLTKVVGDTPPVFPREPHGNYVVTVRAMTKNMELHLPDPLGGMVDGAIFTLFNDDPVDAVMLRPGDSKDFINGGSGQNVPAENFATFVYDLATRSFTEIEAGYIPAARINISNYVERTLKDKDLLHTTAEIKAMGGTGGTSGITMIDKDGSIATDVVSATFTNAVITHDASGNATVKSQTGIDVGADSQTFTGIEKLNFNNMTPNLNSQDGSLYLTPKNTGGNFVLSVKDNEGTDTVDVDTLVFESSITEPDNLDSKEIRIKPYIDFTNVSVSEEPQATSVKANTLSVVHPLEVFADPNSELDAELSLAHGSIELGHAPSYLAYAHSEIAIVGKEGLSGHHDGTIWFDDVVYPSNAFLSVDENDKSISIQEADVLDPNVTGGTDYLIALRLHMQGNAPDDGKVRIYLWDKAKNAYLKDVNGDPMGSQRLYKYNEELGYITVMGVVNAKGSTAFTIHVMDDFVDDELIISSRTEGASGILVQALTSKEKTSPALLQFEQDSNQEIDFDSKYFGPNLVSLAWMLQEDSNVGTVAAGKIKGLNDGSLIHAIGQTALSISDKTFNITSADFNLGKFINVDDTHSLRGKTLKAYTTLANPDGDLVMALFKWTGQPNAATTEIYGSRNQGGGIVPVAGWELVEEDVIVTNALGDFKEYSKNFTVPDEAIELAIILYPSLGLTTDNIRIKGFNVDVLNPFNAYIVKAPELYTEQHLKFNPQYAKLVQDREYYASLRYTLNNTPAEGVPMPVGMIKAGKADISIDKSVNKVIGSAAVGGEGAIKFNAEGRIVVKSELYIYPGESLKKGNKATARFWYSTVSDDGNTFTKIDDSETSFLITGGDLPSKCKMRPFGMDVKTGDRIVLLSLTDATDDAYILANFTSALLTTEISFEEIIAQGYDPVFDLVDLSQFEKTYTGVMTAAKFVSNVSSKVFTLDLPSDMNVSILGAMKQVGDTVRPVKSLDWSYNNNTKKLMISFGETVALGEVLIGVYSA